LLEELQRSAVEQEKVAVVTKNSTIGWNGSTAVSSMMADLEVNAA
jgi:hypothetical protein